MTILLICGSRHASQPMLTYAHNCAMRAIENGWSLIAGDAIGIDKQVAQTVYDYNLTSDYDCNGDLLTVYGVQPMARHGIFARCSRYYNVMDEEKYSIFALDKDGKRYRCNRYLAVKVKDYTTRDKFMVHVADKIMCIWNGESKGTKAVYEYAQTLGKESWLKEF